MKKKLYTNYLLLNEYLEGNSNLPFAEANIICNIIDIFKENSDNLYKIDDINDILKYLNANEDDELKLRKLENLKFEKNSFDLTDLLIKHKKYHWLKEILVSNIDIEKRLEILCDCFKNSSTKENGIFMKYLSSIEDGQIRLLFKYFCSKYNKKYSKDELFNDLMYCDNFEEIYDSLHEKINFNNLIWSLNENDETNMVSSVVFLYNNLNLENNIRLSEKNYLKKLFDDESYKKLDSDIRVNNDKVLVDILDVNDLPELILYDNFYISVEKIKIFVTKIINQYDKIENIDNLVKQISDSIIRKAKNKDDYKIMQRYDQFFINRFYTIYKEQVEHKIIRQSLVKKLSQLNNYLNDMIKVPNDDTERKIKSSYLVKEMLPVKD